MRQPMSYGLSSEERRVLTVRVESARARSQERVVECLRHRSEVEREADISRLASARDAADTALRHSVEEYAALLRQIETLPENVVIYVKQMIRDGSADVPGTHPLVEREVTSVVVGWAIAGFFATR